MNKAYQYRTLRLQRAYCKRSAIKTVCINTAEPRGYYLLYNVGCGLKKISLKKNLRKSSYGRELGAYLNVHDNVCVNVIEVVISRSSSDKLLELNRNTSRNRGEFLIKYVYNCSKNSACFKCQRAFSSTVCVEGDRRVMVCMYRGEGKSFATKRR